MRLTHIGAATCLLEVGGLRLLTDPALGPAGRMHVHPTRSFPFARRGRTPPVFEPDQLRDLDAVLLSHDQHFDNLDPAGRKVLRSARIVVTTRAGAKRLGDNAIGLAPWQDVWLESCREHFRLRITATPARHGPPILWRLAGAVAGFVLTWEGQRHGAVYLSGDTRFFGGVREVGRRFRVGTALLNLGGARFRATGPVRYSMTAREATRAAAALSARTVVPLHYEGWSHFREARPTAEEVLAAGSTPARVCWLPIGQPHDLECDRFGDRQETLTRLGRQDTLTRMVEPTEVVAQTTSADPEIGLRGVASLRALLEAVEELQVRRARELGWSWREIAALLGVSKQAVHQKYGKGEPKRRRRFG